MQTFWDTPYGSFVVQVLRCGGRVKNLKNTDFYNFQAIFTAPDILQAKINAFIVKESLNQRVFKKQVFQFVGKKSSQFCRAMLFTNPSTLAIRNLAIVLSDCFKVAPI